MWWSADALWTIADENRFLTWWQVAESAGFFSSNLFFGDRVSMVVRAYCLAVGRPYPTRARRSTTRSVPLDSSHDTR